MSGVKSKLTVCTRPLSCYELMLVNLYMYLPHSH